MCFSKVEMLQFCPNVVYIVCLHWLYFVSPWELPCFLEIITIKIVLRVTFKICLFSHLFPLLIQRVYNNVVYHFYAFLVTNNVYLRFEQKSGITETIKQKKSVKVYLPPPNGHGDCATDLCFTLNFNSVLLLSALAILDLSLIHI